jgi:hypothetical protein
MLCCALLGVAAWNVCGLAQSRLVTRRQSWCPVNFYKTSHMLLADTKCYNAAELANNMCFCTQMHRHSIYIRNCHDRDCLRRTNAHTQLAARDGTVARQGWQGVAESLLQAVHSQSDSHTHKAQLLLLSWWALCCLCSPLWTRSLLHPCLSHPGPPQSPRRVS